MINLSHVNLEERRTQQLLATSSSYLIQVQPDEPLRQAIVEKVIRERLFPKPGDLLYLPLADLLLAVKEMATSEPVTVLDYGAGLAPYRSLFTDSQYRTADVASSTTFCDGLIGTPERNEFFLAPDYIILPDGCIQVESNTF